MTQCASSDPLKSHITTLYKPVYVIPQVNGYSEEEGRVHIGFESIMVMKVKCTTILVLILVGPGRASVTAIGTPTLIVGNQSYREINPRIDSDLGNLENSISILASPTDSLVKVVLQN